MALPAIVLTGLKHAAMNPKVQNFAGRLAKDVYGKIMSPDQKGASEDLHSIAIEPLTLDDMAERLEAVPTKEDLAASLGFLQAELDQQNRKTRRYIIAATIFNSAVIATLVLIY